MQATEGQTGHRFEGWTDRSETDWRRPLTLAHFLVSVGQRAVLGRKTPLADAGKLECLVDGQARDVVVVLVHVAHLEKPDRP
jgi:hypothetical protein